MSKFKIGDIVGRKSYGGDVFFVVTGIRKTNSGKEMCTLKGMMHRLEADSLESDLELFNENEVNVRISRDLRAIEEYAAQYYRGNLLTYLRMMRSKPGRILHIDSDQKFLDMSLSHYRNAGIRAVSHVVPEEEQPKVIGRLLQQTKPDILVATGHDGFRKGSNQNIMANYRKSRYYVDTVTEARKYEPNIDRLCIFAGACQSYYEALMQAGANFASSPARVLINAVDPAIVGDKVANTSVNSMVTPRQISNLTKSGSQGIGGINTKGKMK